MRLTRGSFAGAFALAVLMVAPGAANAATIPVTSLADSGGGTLRTAITTASTNGAGTNDTITFTVNGTITLSSQLPPIPSAAMQGQLTIQGPGSTALTVARSGAAPQFPVFTAVAGADGTISGMKITGGSSATTGGGVLTAGALKLERVEISGNTALGAGSGGAGAATLASGSLTLRDSTVSGNQAGGVGGGGVLGTPSASVTIERTTISGNSTTAISGAGIRADGPMIVRSSTIASNTGPGGTPLAGKNVVVGGGALSFENTIVADAKSANTSETTINCQVSSGAIISLGFSMADDTSCSLGSPTDIPNVDPGLGPLQVNTQGTPTHALTVNSPAIDKGDAGLVSGTTDQRGLLRPVDFADKPNAAGGDGSDIGAFELNFGQRFVCGPPEIVFFAHAKNVSDRCSFPPPPCTGKSCKPAPKCKKSKKGKKAGASAKKKPKCGKKKPKKK